MRGKGYCVFSCSFESKKGNGWYSHRASVRSDVRLEMILTPPAVRIIISYFKVWAMLRQKACCTQTDIATPCLSSFRVYFHPCVIRLVFSCTHIHWLIDWVQSNINISTYTYMHTQCTYRTHLYAHKHTHALFHLLHSNLWVMCFCTVWLKKRRKIVIGVCVIILCYYGCFNKAFTVLWCFVCIVWTAMIIISKQTCTGLYLTQAWCSGRHMYRMCSQNLSFSQKASYLLSSVCYLYFVYSVHFFSLVVFYWKCIWWTAEWFFLLPFNDFSPQTFCLFPYFCIYLSCSALILGKVNSLYSNVT